MPKDSRNPPPIPLPFSGLPSVLDASRTLTLFLASAASFSKSQCFPLCHFPPIKLKTDILIHQAVLEGYYIEGGETAVDLTFKSSKIFSGRLLKGKVPGIKMIGYLIPFFVIV